jgi:hypothetical protein
MQGDVGGGSSTAAAQGGVAWPAEDSCMAFPYLVTLLGFTQLRCHL